MIRTAWLLFVMLLVTPPLSLVIIIRSFMGPGGEPIYDRIPRFWARLALRAGGIEVTGIGLEHVAPGRPQIFLANHVSWYDVLALTWLIPKRYRFVGKKELTRVPLWGRAWLASGHISIDRSDTFRAVESLEKAGQAVREDRSSIIIFPEGTRSSDGRLQRFKKGAFMLALHTGIEIVPVAVQGTHAILPKGSWRVRPGRIIVRFGAPIDSAAYTLDQREELMARVHADIAAMLDARPPQLTGDNVRHHQHTRP